ncbi:MAG TPA: PadR family transcriptional regulator [Steroidobacteraceae bacterium]|jgi:DNA-binding PadR family transcriptional regulator|nr:PadR family transcriptional regulator [Steroidobacteraceae bacterium]
MHHRLHHFFGRHHGGHGSGHFGRGFMGGDMGGRAFGMGRKLASVDLQLLILGLLAEKPRHGYEIIKALDERSKGFYVPSPGMVYPALTYLEEIGHATVETEGTRKLYHITEAGKQHLEEHRDRAESLLGQFERVGERMDRLRRAMHAEETGEADSEDRRSHERRGSRELLRARHDLKAALADKWDSPRAEQQRMVEILKRATKEILGQ